MNIAHIVPHSVAFPLMTHNGRYDWVLQLAMIQVSSGHDVTIYCHPRSRIDGLRTSGIPDATHDKQLNNIKTFRLALQNNHDIYHSHFDNLHYQLSRETTKPIVYTQHWWPHEETIRLASTHTPSNVWAVPPTHYMYEFDRQTGIPSKGHIYHGIDLEVFHAAKVPKHNRLLFVGRISPEKHLDLAISLSKQSGIGLDIIGKVTEKNIPYWDSLRSAIDGEHIRYLGAKSRRELIDYYTSARALLFPSDITETFGLAAIEAQACGTPVIMRRGGSRGELIEEGKTGFLCETEADYLAAIKLASTVHPSDCIRHARKFDVRVMAKNYEALYKQLLTN